MSNKLKIRGLDFFTPQPPTTGGVLPLVIEKYQLYRILMSDTWLDSSWRAEKMLRINLYPKTNFYPPKWGKTKKWAYLGIFGFAYEGTKVRINFNFMVDLVSLGVLLVKIMRVKIFWPPTPTTGGNLPPLCQNVNFIIYQCVIHCWTRLGELNKCWKTTYTLKPIFTPKMG